jgi:hypothetical protein
VVASLTKSLIAAHSCIGLHLSEHVDKPGSPVLPKNVEVPLGPR